VPQVEGICGSTESSVFKLTSSRLFSLYVKVDTHFLPYEKQNGKSQSLLKYYVCSVCEDSTLTSGIYLLTFKIKKTSKSSFTGKWIKKGKYEI
jgi:hypothetical protein